MKTVAEINDSVRGNTGEHSLVYTSGVGLEKLNQIYRSLAASLEWPEFSRIDTTLVTVADQNSYTWPATIMRLVTSVEINNSNVGADIGFHAIGKAPIPQEWSRASRLPSVAVPYYFEKNSTSDTVHELELRPAPAYSGESIRIKGVTEPSELLQDSTTAFQTRSADDALSHLVSADYFFLKGSITAVQSELAKATFLLSQLFNDQLPANIAGSITGIPNG